MLGLGMVGIVKTDVGTQSRSVKVVKVLEQFLYKERLRKMGLLSLEKRREILSVYVNT